MYCIAFVKYYFKLMPCGHGGGVSHVTVKILSDCFYYIIYRLKIKNLMISTMSQAVAMPSFTSDVCFPFTFNDLGYSRRNDTYFYSIQDI